jgi:hypothetical protein
LTPESIAYINQAMKDKQKTKLDDEMIYAGLHTDNVGAIKFKRTEKNKQRFKGRSKRSKKKTGRFA